MTERHEITIWKDVDLWCAAHRYNGEHDTSDALPLDAQDDPEGYCRRRWPEAEIRIDE